MKKWLILPTAMVVAAFLVSGNPASANSYSFVQYDGGGAGTMTSANGTLSFITHADEATVIRDIENPGAPSTTITIQLNAGEYFSGNQNEYINWTTWSFGGTLATLYHSPAIAPGGGTQLLTYYGASGLRYIIIVDFTG